MRALLALLLVLPALLARAQPRTVGFLQGASDEILSAYYEPEAAALFTLDKLGFVVTWDVNSLRPVARFYPVPSYLSETSKSPYHIDRKMVAATADKLWVYDVSNGLPKPQLDAYDRRSGRYVIPTAAERSAFEARFITNNPAAPTLAMKPDEAEKGRAAHGSYQLTFSARSISIAAKTGQAVPGGALEASRLGLLSINNVFFLTDEVLLICGQGMNGRGDFYTGGEVATKAALLKYNWKTGLLSTDRSNDKKLNVLANAQLEIASDSVLFLKNRSGSWVHQLQPGRLANQFLATENGDPRTERYLSGKGFKPQVESFKLEDGQTSRELGLLPDSYASGNVYQALPYTNARMALVAHRPDGQLGDILFYEHLAGYVPVQLHSRKRLLLWRQLKPGSGEHKFVLSNLEGKIVGELPVVGLQYEPLLRFSPDGNWLSCVANGAEVLVFNTERFGEPLAVGTGLTAAQYYGGRLQFDAPSGRLACTRYNPANFNQFVLAAVDLATGRQATLFQGLNSPPDAWCLDADFGRVALYYPLNFADTAVFLNKRRTAEAVAHGLRNVYSPTIFLADVKTANFDQIVPVDQRNPVRSMAFMGARLVAVQQDGLLHYYDPKGAHPPLTQWLSGAEQAIRTEGYYYATPGLVDLMQAGAPGSMGPAGQQDVLFNAPHKILQQLDPSQSELLNTYRLAYEKRLSQYDHPVAAAGAGHLPVIKLATHDWHDMAVKDSVLRLRVQLPQPHTVQKLLVRVNGTSVFGRAGFVLVGSPAEVLLKIPLDSGYNDVRIQAVDRAGQYSAPLLLEHTARYRLRKAPSRLWVLTAGVSAYADTAFSLKYAAKDARDFANVFGFKTAEKTEVLTLTDRQVTAASVVGALQQGHIGKNDVVVVYLAGHGLLNATGDFYFAPHDMDFRHPESKGLSYARLMNALERLPARHKVLFLDACNSGFVDRSRYTAPARPLPDAAPGSRLTRQGARGAADVSRSAAVADKDVFLFMQKTFADFSQDNNVSILAAALGNSYALENPTLQNGLFTYALIKGLGLAQADTDPPTLPREYGEASFVSLPELAQYLDQEVRSLSQGAQVPTFSLSRQAQWLGFAESFYKLQVESLGTYHAYGEPVKLSKGEAYKQFLDRYKK